MTQKDEQHLNFKYLPSVEHDLDWGLTVNCIGTQEILPGEPYPPAGHPLSHRFILEFQNCSDLGLYGNRSHQAGRLQWAVGIPMLPRSRS